MHNRPLVRSVWLALLVFVFTTLAAAAQNGTTSIAYTIAMPRPHTHLFEIQITITRGLMTPRTHDDFVMPVWTPGSYLIREFERHVQDFTATDPEFLRMTDEDVEKAIDEIRAALRKNAPQR